VTGRDDVVRHDIADFYDYAQFMHIMLAILPANIRAWQSMS
jgi:hypothetical protein